METGGPILYTSSIVSNIYYNSTLFACRFLEVSHAGGHGDGMKTIHFTYLHVRVEKPYGDPRTKDRILDSKDNHALSIYNPLGTEGLLV